MNRRLFVLVLTLLFIESGCTRHSDSGSRTALRIGWQVPLATQGQIVEVLKNTQLLKQDKIDAKFIPFTYGGPQSEAALAGELDVIFVGDQPAINLIARGGRWKIVSRLFYTKTALMVPMASPISRVAQLQGKYVATPFGSVAHREATLKQEAAGLVPARDVHNVNLDILEISSLVQAGGGQSWKNIDAVGVWEPSTSLFELNKLARTIDYTRTLGVVAISEEFLASHRSTTVRFLLDVLKAWTYYSDNPGKVDQWYVDDARLSYPLAVLQAAVSVEPNIAAKSLGDIDLMLKEADLRTLEKSAQWSYRAGFSKTEVSIRKAVDTSYLRDAILEANKTAFDPKSVVVNPAVSHGVHGK